MMYRIVYLESDRWSGSKEVEGRAYKTEKAASAAFDKEVRRFNREYSRGIVPEYYAKPLYIKECDQ